MSIAEKIRLSLRSSKNTDSRPKLFKALNADSGLNGLALLLLAGNGLGTHDTTTPVAAGVLVLVGVALLDGGEELGELSLVLGAGLSESENGGGLDDELVSDDLQVDEISI